MEHHTQIDVKIGPQWGIRACWVRCSCGYISGPFQDEPEAKADRDEHMKADERHRPCEHPKCLAVDSTKCFYKVSENTGMVIPSQLERAKRNGCRVARFDKKTT